jgi:hypothetical protein
MIFGFFMCSGHDKTLSTSRLYPIVLKKSRWSFHSTFSFDIITYRAL